jgi:hypothetical protein
MMTRILSLFLSEINIPYFGDEILFDGNVDSQTLLDTGENIFIRVTLLQKVHSFVEIKAMVLSDIPSIIKDYNYGRRTETCSRSKKFDCITDLLAAAW